MESWYEGIDLCVPLEGLIVNQLKNNQLKNKKKQVESWYEGIDLCVPLSRAKFEALNDRFFVKCLDTGTLQLLYFPPLFLDTSSA